MSRKSRTRALWAAFACAAIVGTASAAVPALATEDPGTVAGHLTDAGSPVPEAFVALVDGDFNFVTTARTDADGAYLLTDVPAGSYRLYFVTFGGYEQWAVQKRSFEEADLITVAGGGTTTVDEQLRPHGSLSGHVTSADGAPVPFALVQASLMNGQPGSGFDQADADGFYTVTHLEPGDYRVSFQKDFSSPLQYANNARTYDAATPITVSLGATTTLDQTLLPVGTLKGQVTENGVGVGDVRIEAFDINGGGQGFAGTDANGNYEISLWSGTYAVQFQRPDGLVQYAPREIDQNKAGQYQITAGTQTVLNERLRATGTVSGRLTMPGGEPVAGASVDIRSRAVTQFVSTDADGFYQAKVYPGSYTIGFGTQFGGQWWHGRATPDLSDPVSVTAGATISADDVLNPFGTLTVTAVNTATGEALTSFCAYLSFTSQCTDTGSLTVPQILPGRYTISAYPQEGDNFVTTGVVAVVASGANTSVELPVATGATVSTVMTDAKTGAPVENACLELVNVLSPRSLGVGGERCSDATGHVILPQLRAGSYKAFVWARDGVHGHQWVGASGGVGKFKRAVTITLAAGAEATLPPIKLDKAGRITGTVTDEITGAPIRLTTVALSTYNAGLGGGGGLVFTDAQGRYTVSDLGPYNWTLYFAAEHYASEWSGNSAYRDRAAGIRVRRGATSTYDNALGVGTTVTGRVSGPTGVRADSARITILNADTADEMGSGDTYLSIRRYVVQVKGPQRIKLEYFGNVGQQYYMGLVGGSTFADATVFNIPAGGEKRLNVTLTQILTP